MPTPSQRFAGCAPAWSTARRRPQTSMGLWRACMRHAGAPARHHCRPPAQRQGRARPAEAGPCRATRTRHAVRA
ncbi:hypothetical protein [Massilia yuzhufengensis]|uniref:hypothetical protein n=1 Tax=Massilia yuzhufengensis TaxID=1164594 RepID=UPI0011608FD4|nr:hypothetical protein [Massilia yuzhufengensis]